MNIVKFIVIATGVAVLTEACKGRNEFDASGAFEATEVMVSSEAGGKLMEFNVLEGDKLDKGECVGYVDSIQLYLRKMQTEASIKATQNRRPEIAKQIAAIQQQIATAEYERERIVKLLKDNAANPKQLDDSDAAIALLKKQLAAQMSTLSTTDRAIVEDITAMDYQMRQLEDQLVKCRIINPVSGTVLAKYAEPGEVTVPGKALYKIADLDRVFLRAYITSGQLSQLKLGQTVKVFADFGDKKYREYPGEVTWISGQAEFTPKTIQTKDERANLVYAVKIIVKNDGYLKLGMYGEIKIDTVGN